VTPVTDAAIRGVGYALVLPWDIHHVGGVNRVVSDLYAELDAAGDYVPYLLIASWAHMDPTFDADAHGRRTIRLRMRGFLSSDRGWLLRYLTLLARLPGEIRKVLSTIKRYRLGVVNIHYVTDTAFIWALLKFLGFFRGDLVFSFHGTDVHVLSGQRGISRWLSRWMLRQADALVPCSIDMRGRLLNAFRLDPIRASTIHNGIDIDAVLAATKEVRASHKRSSSPLIVSLGSFDRVKGHDVLVRAFAELLQHRPDAKLVIAGRPGPALAQLQEQIGAARLTEQIELRIDATHDQAMQLLARADVFALASRREGLPLTILEAAVLRVPVVASNVGGIPELVRSEHDGILPPAEDATALTAALLRMLTAQDVAAKMAMSLHERVMSRHTLQTMVNAYMQVVRARI